MVKTKKVSITQEIFNNLKSGDVIVDDKGEEWKVVDLEALITIDSHRTIKPPDKNQAINIIWKKGQIVDENYKAIRKLNTNKVCIKLAA